MKCPLHDEDCGERVKRGLFKCTTLNKVFNADLVGAYNILIASSLEKGNGPEARPEAEPPEREDVAPNLPALLGALALQGGEGVGWQVLRSLALVEALPP